MPSRFAAFAALLSRMKTKKQKPEPVARTYITIIGDSCQKATISEKGSIGFTYHGPKAAGDRGELLPGHHRDRRKISPIFTGEISNKSTLIYSANSNDHIAEHVVPGWLKQSDGEELHQGGRTIRWRRKTWEWSMTNITVKLYDGDKHVASLKMRQSLGGPPPYGEILWYTDTYTLKNVLVEGQMFYAIIYVASEFITRQMARNRRLAGGVGGAGIDAGMNLALG